MSVKETPAAEAADEEEVVAETEDKVVAKEGDEPESDEAEDGEEAETEDKPEDGDDKPSKSKLKRERLKARIATLEEIARHESDRADKTAAELRRLKGDVGPAPKEADYADERSYTAALNAYEADKRVTARTQQNTEAAAKEARESADASIENLFRERALALVDRYPDIEARVFNDATLPVSRAMAGIIQDKERGPEVAYYLATHRETAQRIAKMSSDDAAWALGEIAATLDAPKPRTQSKAPPPATIVKGTRSTAAVVDWDKRPIEEWVAWRETQLGIRKKA